MFNMGFIVRNPGFILGYRKGFARNVTGGKAYGWSPFPKEGFHGKVEAGRSVVSDLFVIGGDNVGVGINCCPHTGHRGEGCGGGEGIIIRFHSLPRDEFVDNLVNTILIVYRSISTEIRNSTGIQGVSVQEDSTSVEQGDISKGNDFSDVDHTVTEPPTGVTATEEAADSTSRFPETSEGPPCCISTPHLRLMQELTLRGLYSAHSFLHTQQFLPA